MLTRSLMAGSALAVTDKAGKQGQIRKTAQTALERFYMARPAHREQVAKAPGCAVFTSDGMSLFIGGAGGKGLAHYARTKYHTLMEVARASAGLQAGIAQGETLIAEASCFALTKNGTKNGLEAGGAVAGTRLWQDKDLR